jgi:hypothetical protein
MLKGNSSFAGNLDIQLAQPADGRQICQYKNDLYNLDSWKASDGNRYLWKGMQTYVQETGEWYELVAEPTDENIVKTTSWKKLPTIDDIENISLTPGSPGPQGIGFIPCSWSTYQDLAENIKVIIDGTEYSFLEKFPAFSSNEFSNWLNNTYNWANHNSDVCIYASDYYPYLTSTDPTNYPDDYIGYVAEAMIECAEKFVELYNAIPVAPWGDYPSITETGVWWGGNLFGKGGPSVLATDDSIGGFKTGYSENGKNYPIELSEGKAYVNVPWVDTNTAHTHTAGTGLSIGDNTGGTSGTVTLSLNTASASSLGGIKIGYSNNDKNYGISLDSNESAYVNVPWVNTAHSHTAGTGLSIGSDTGGTEGEVTLSLNTASASSLGGIKVGDNLNIGTDGKLTAKGYTWTTGSTGSNNTMTIDNGQINAAHGFYETSDARKKDIQGELPLDKAYDFIRDCEPILYNLKGSDKTQIGLIAQEVQEFFPEIVNEDEEGYLSLDYAKLTVIILRVLKDLIDKK